MSTPLPLSTIDPVERFLMCDCHTHALLLSWSPEDSTLYLAKFSCGTRSSWKDRFRMIWKIVKDGTPYEDELVFSGKYYTELRNMIDSLPRTGIASSAHQEGRMSTFTPRLTTELTQHSQRLIICDCDTNALLLSWWPEESTLYLTKCSFGNHPSWKDRLRMIWKIIEDGTPYEDELVFSGKHYVELRNVIDSLPRTEMAPPIRKLENS
mgnify:CR=1 FL=1